MIPNSHELGQPPSPKQDAPTTSDPPAQSPIATYKPYACAGTEEKNFYRSGQREEMVQGIPGEEIMAIACTGSLAPGFSMPTATLPSKLYKHPDFSSAASGFDSPQRQPMLNQAIISPVSLVSSTETSDVEYGSLVGLGIGATDHHKAFATNRSDTYHTQTDPFSMVNYGLHPWIADFRSTERQANCPRNMPDPPDAAHHHTFASVSTIGRSSEVPCFLGSTISPNSPWISSFECPIIPLPTFGSVNATQRGA